eukprot:CAMPEP_0185768522 /NCGR_PEP_ID=MMETSP1174-20130828/50195_1 /TAXON_ID=35687 /ORGANISM="Dictyocha speculum, Strain CCMP1381" /LENGTH=323 /DNA_ID=CAMNT_0028453239 /DNA_START=13 /DNA_END=984 /DNA_ORIENTATION=+
MKGARSRPGLIKNKEKRQQVYAKLKLLKKKGKREKRGENKRRAVEAGELGCEPVKKKPKTLETERVNDPTFVKPQDDEVFGDEAGDEFASIFANTEKPKLMITTRPKPTKELFLFIGNLLQIFPKAYYYERKKFDVKQICGFASQKDFTHLVVLGEQDKQCNGMIISRLPHGPTAFFKVSNVELSSQLKHRGRQTGHMPEIILNNFTTRVGRRVGRFLGSLFPHEPEFKGRQAVTFHNQRDFIFVRHHRYIFDETETDGKTDGKKADSRNPVPGVKARLQELGPRFTLKMRWLQLGSFDTKDGEYEWMHNRKAMDTDRRRFHL